MRTTLLSLALLCPTIASAHDDPHDVIDTLTHKIEKGANLTQCYFERAIEYRSLGKNKHALSDLEAVIKRRPKHTRSHVLRGHILTTLKEYTKAHQSYQKALASTKDQAPILISIAELYILQKNHKAAFSVSNKAIHSVKKPKVEWFLIRARTQLQLGHYKARAKMLQAATKKNSSIVLKYAWIDATLDAGQTEAVDVLVQTELNSSRHTSAWLIRSARINKLKKLPYREQLEQAVKEINLRLNPQRPDLSILVERCHASFLLGKNKEALKDLSLLKKRPSMAGDTDYLQHFFGDIK